MGTESLAEEVGVGEDGEEIAERLRSWLGLCMSLVFEILICPSSGCQSCL